MPKTEIVYLALLMVIANFVSAQSKALIEINNPFINLSYPDKSIAIKALSIKNIEGNKYILEGPIVEIKSCLLYTSPSPRDYAAARMPSSA